MMCCSYYAQLKKEEEEREKELAKKYRDRVCDCEISVQLNRLNLFDKQF